MPEKTTVAFRIDESVKEEWEDAAEGPEYDSVSHLIRLSVQKEITDTETTETDAQAGAGPAENSEVLDSLTRLERTVEDIQDEMRAVSSESRSGELYSLEQVLLETLPTASKDLDPTTELEPEQFESGATTPHDIAGKIGADTSDVTDALERLADNTGQVRSVENQKTGDNYYWRSQ